ncbi:hypothetical protein O181_108042 [Austropuccinia psidii MF-1]|uniref:Uncharacterized protein n=1 Tax=Austropuccinia psidii MF-1 TaxID=1389203 RepID=A0A9Q3PQ01_9BASI|nr:hypothetical protein [Austropuccinia psidii MF-1]
MHHACNLKYGWYEGMEKIPHRLRGRLTELIWWPLVAARGHGQNWVLLDLWPNWCPTGLWPILAQVGPRDWWPILAQVGPIVVWDPPGLGARWMPPLAPFGLIGLRTVDHESRPTGRRSRRGPKWPKKAI